MAWRHREPEAFEMMEPTRRVTLPPLAAEATPNPPSQRTRHKRRAAERQRWTSLLSPPVFDPNAPNGPQTPQWALAYCGRTLHAGMFQPDGGPGERPPRTHRGRPMHWLRSDVDSLVYFGSRLLVACWIVSALAGLAQAKAFVLKDVGRGAVGAFNTCVPQSNGDQLCEDFIVEYFIVSPNNAMQGTAVFTHYKAFIHPDGTADEFVPELGFAGVTGSYDISHLTLASMSGITLYLNDVDPITGDLTPNGRMVTLGAFVWTAASDIYVFSNDGPFGIGLPRHVVYECVTQIYNAHERFTTAHVTGTINGISVAEYGPAYLPWPGTAPADALGAVTDVRIKFITAPHSGGC